MKDLNSKNLYESIKRQKQIINHSIVLTPVDSFSIYGEGANSFSYIEGLYSTDRPRNENDIMASKIFFSGRERIMYDTKKIYDTWSNILGAKAASMRLLSGLHAHVVIFMGLCNIGENIMLLPEIAGGHFATKSILTRLGYNVIDVPIDLNTMRVNVSNALKTISEKKILFLFIDRSEGLVYEDLTMLATKCSKAGVYSIFDASQYLSGIISKTYKSPFDMGFDLIISTLHKSFPGPQKALVASKKEDVYWEKIKSGMSNYVSSSHIRSTYLAGLGISNINRIINFNSKMLENATLLEKKLKYEGVSVKERDVLLPPTQHIWILFNNKEDAFSAFKSLEKCRIHTTYRLLPYKLGYGLRLGTAAATMQGLTPIHINDLASIIKKSMDYGFSLKLRHKVRDICYSMESYKLE